MPRSHARLDLSVFVGKPLLFAIALVTVALSGQAIAHIIQNANIVDLAASIENGAPHDISYLKRLASSKDFLADRGDCNDTSTRARLTVALAEDQSIRGANQPPLPVALEAATQRLKCSPLDGNAWAQIARLKSRSDGPTLAVIDDIRASYLTAPNENWIVDDRIDFVSGLTLVGVTGLDTEFGEDLRRFVEFNPSDRVAVSYVGFAAPIRARLRPLIDTQIEARRKSIIAEIDRLGVDYTRP